MFRGIGSKKLTIKQYSKIAGKSNILIYPDSKCLELLLLNMILLNIIEGMESPDQSNADMDLFTDRTRYYNGSLKVRKT